MANKVMNKYEFAKHARYIAEHPKTCYMLGAFGHFTNTTNISYEVARRDVNNKPYEQAALNIKDKGFMFDCCGLIKGILWGWNEFPGEYGGARYASNGVPDISADTFITYTDASTDFTNIDVGEIVWMKGHVGIYVGDGYVAEATPRWEISPRGVKLTVCQNISTAGGWGRKWTKHGKLPWVDYDVQKESDDMYHNLNEVPDYAKEAIKWYIDNGYLAGVAPDDLALSQDMTRVLTILYRVMKKEN